MELTQLDSISGKCVYLPCKLYFFWPHSLVSGLYGVRPSILVLQLVAPATAAALVSALYLVGTSVLGSHANTDKI